MESRRVKANKFYVENLEKLFINRDMKVDFKIRNIQDETAINDRYSVPMSSTMKKALQKLPARQRNAKLREIIQVFIKENLG